MRARKLLRGTHTSISEDLTFVNLQRMKDVKSSPRIEDSWGWNEKVFAKGLDGRSFVIRLNSNIDELLDNENMGE